MGKIVRLTEGQLRKIIENTIEEMKFPWSKKRKDNENYENKWIGKHPFPGTMAALEKMFKQEDEYNKKHPFYRALIDLGRIYSFKE